MIQRDSGTSVSSGEVRQQRGSVTMRRIAGLTIIAIPVFVAVGLIAVKSSVTVALIGFGSIVGIVGCASVGAFLLSDE